MPKIAFGLLGDIALALVPTALPDGSLDFFNRLKDRERNR
jgi:hypothetical protein